MKFCTIPEQVSVKIKDEGPSIDLLINDQHTIRTTKIPFWTPTKGPVNISLNKQFVNPAFDIHDIPLRRHPNVIELYFEQDALNYTNQLKYYEDLTK